MFPTVETEGYGENAYKLCLNQIDLLRITKNAINIK
jgi:hypothetical protein